jgi:hypothetical protein
MIQAEVVQAVPLPNGEAPYVYPLDRPAEELRCLDIDELVSEAREHGYVITRKMIRAWMRLGLLPKR